MQFLKTTYIFILAFLLQVSLVHAQDALDGYMDRIDEAENAQQLYSIRIGIEKYAKNPGLTLQQQKKLAKVFERLAESFQQFNHYRNAADVYRNYLSLNEVYLKNYNQFLEDSLKKKHSEMEISDRKQIADLDAEIIQLQNTKAAVTGLKQKYYTFGTIATIALIVIFLFIFLTRNRAIRTTTDKLASNRKQMEEMQAVVIHTRLVSGSVIYSKMIASENLEVPSLVIENYGTAGKSSKEIEALKKAQQTLSEISTIN